MPTVAGDLAEVLGTINSPGEFYAAGTMEMFAPGLEVDGVGQIAMPLLPFQAEQLIALAERAPYGRGEETLTDVSVRRTWQIGPEQVRISGRHWPATIEAILVRVIEGLGVKEPVAAAFYKLLIYDQGSYFVRHRDTEKLPGMFATLIVVLPSISDGGELVVRHKDREARLNLRCEDAAQCSFAAFYADCVHEVLPVTSGYRLALVYNLVRSGPGPLPVPADHSPQEHDVEMLLRQWFEEWRPAENDDPDDDDDIGGEDDDRDPDDEDDTVGGERGRPEKLVLLLEHAYTPAGLGFDALKGADAGVARVVMAAAERIGCDVHLALVTVEESGSAEYTGYRRSRRDWRDRDYEDEPEGFEVLELTNRTVIAANFRRPDGQAAALTEIPVLDDEFSDPEAFEGLEPDEEHFHEATGNAGASFERTYRRAALVLWPRDRLFAVINQGGVTVAMAYLSDLIERWIAAGKPADSVLWRTARDFATQTVLAFPMSDWRPRRGGEPSTVGRMLTLLSGLEDFENARLLLAALAGRGGFDVGDAASIADAICRLPPDRAASLARRIVSAAVECAPSACAALLARGAEVRSAIFLDAAEVFVDALPNKRAPEGWPRGPGMSAAFVVDSLTALSSIDSGLAGRAATHVLANPVAYELDGILVPAVKNMLGSEVVRRSDAVRQVLRACVAHLDARIAQPLAPPRDWSRPSTLSCTCGHCTDLSRFLADPVQSRWSYKANATERGHVETTIRYANCDVDTATESRSRPYSLICTKNQASYERRRMQREKDLADLDLLKI